MFLTFSLACALPDRVRTMLELLTHRRRGDAFTGGVGTGHAEIIGMSRLGLGFIYRPAMAIIDPSQISGECPDRC